MCFTWHRDLKHEYIKTQCPWAEFPGIAGTEIRSRLSSSDHEASRLSLINCFHRIAGAGADIAELVAATRPGGGGTSSPCLALLNVTDVFWVEILSPADLVMQLLQPLSQSLTEQSRQEQEMINTLSFKWNKWPLSTWNELLDRAIYINDRETCF